MEELAGLLLEYDHLHVLSGKDSSVHYEWLHSLVTRTHVYSLQTMLVVCQALAEHLVGRMPPTASPDLRKLTTPVLHTAFFDPIPRTSAETELYPANHVTDNFYALPPKDPEDREYVLRKSLDATSHLYHFESVQTKIHCDTRLSLGYLLGRDAADLCARAPQRVCFAVQDCMLHFLARRQWQCKRNNLEFLAYPPPKRLANAVLSPSTRRIDARSAIDLTDHFLLAPLDQGNLNYSIAKSARESVEKRYKRLASVPDKYIAAGNIPAMSDIDNDPSLIDYSTDLCLRWRAVKTYGHITSSSADRIDEDQILTAILLSALQEPGTGDEDSREMTRRQVDYSKASLDFKPSEFDLSPVGVREKIAKFKEKCFQHHRIAWGENDIGSFIEGPKTYEFHKAEHFQEVAIKDGTRLLEAVIIHDLAHEESGLQKLKDILGQIKQPSIVIHIPKIEPHLILLIVNAIFGNEKLAAKTFDVVTESVFVFKYIDGLHKAANLIQGEKPGFAWLNLYVRWEPQSVIFDAPTTALLIFFRSGLGDGAPGRYIHGIVFPSEE